MDRACCPELARAAKFRQAALGYAAGSLRTLGGLWTVRPCSVGLAVCIVRVRTLLLEETALQRQHLQRFVFALVPAFCAILLLSPYLYLMFRFHAATGSASSPGLFYSAFQLAEVPPSILRMLSPHLKLCGRFLSLARFGVLGRFYRGDFYIWISYFQQTHTRRTDIILSLCSRVYIVCSCNLWSLQPVSNLLFHFMPVIGKMHIYQRFLLATGLFSAIMIALMVKAVEAERPPLATRMALAACGTLTCFTAYIVGEQPETARLLRADSYLVFEMIGATLVVLVMLCLHETPSMPRSRGSFFLCRWTEL